MSVDAMLSIEDYNALVIYKISSLAAKLQRSYTLPSVFKGDSHFPPSGETGTEAYYADNWRTVVERIA